MSITFRRKILAAVISSLFFAFIFSIPGGLEMNSFAILYYLNFMFVVSYGVITSLFSDWLSKRIFTSTYSREISSFLFHCLFGSVLKVLSLASAISFFIIDRLLIRVKIKWWTVNLLLLIVILIFFIGINIGD
ncbi:hypothetical protein [Bacillus massilinigeriensis]|uniref:hypothetical protein n=1 Tax=Bacillus massilionigeriensis TaxID=1805475 RepID=UPI000ADB66FA|nr:hypothetical protein [Bacillus massilionigeriensis]